MAEGEDAEVFQGRIESTIQLRISQSECELAAYSFDKYKPALERASYGSGCTCAPGCSLIACDLPQACN